MADMPSDFWSGWITLTTVISLAGLAWLVFSVYFSPEEHEEASPVWDDSLSEGSNPAPMWWFWLILVFMVFSVIYLMLFPGLGSYRGALKWSQGGRLGESYALYDYEFNTKRQEILETPLEVLQNNQTVMKSAQGIFSRNCAACHGPEGDGQANLFPRLNDDIWQWGGEVSLIEQTIRSGRTGAMPAWGAVIDTASMQQLVEYIQTLQSSSSGSANRSENHPGQVSYQTFCVACHGPEGSGNPLLGAPDLTDQDWLYGNDPAAVSHSIANGRQGIMPAFEDRLDDVQIRMLVAWLSRK